MKGQVSAEMLILLAVIIAIVALAGYYLTKTTEDAGKSIDDQSQSILEKQADITNNPESYANQ